MLCYHHHHTTHMSNNRSISHSGLFFWKMYPAWFSDLYKNLLIFFFLPFFLHNRRIQTHSWQTINPLSFFFLFLFVSWSTFFKFRKIVSEKCHLLLMMNGRLNDWSFNPFFACLFAWFFCIFSSSSLNEWTKNE